MPEFYLNKATHTISKKNRRKSDPFFTALAEERILSYLNIYKEEEIFNYPLPIRKLLRFTEIFSGFAYRCLWMSRIPVHKNRILFATFQNSYTCNCKYIAEKLRSQHPELDLTFLVNPDVMENPAAYGFPSDVHLVCRHTIQSFYALASSRVWVDNALNCIWRLVPKKRSQIYLNTWHGSLGIKRLSGSRFWKIAARYSSLFTNYFITDSTYDEKVFRRSYWPHTQFLKAGHPRNDLFFHPDQMALAREKVCSHYGIAPDTRIALYAPTFRDNTNNMEAIQLSFSMLKDSLEEKFGGNWVILCRLHPKNARQTSFREQFENTDYVIDACDYIDIQELLAAADTGITDYSSWIFDYLFTGRPAFIYAADIEQYKHDRGFYYPLDHTPFSIADSDQALSEHIRAFNPSLYNRKVQRFLRSKGCYETGSASQKVADFLSCNTEAPDV